MKLIIAAFLVFLGFIAIPNSFEIVDPGHRGVGVTMGKVHEDVKPEGLNFKLPFITKIIELPVQQITVEGNTDCFSSDLQTVKMNYSVLYRHPESKVVELYRDYKGVPYDTVVKPRLEEAFKQVASKYRAEDMVKSREAIKALSMEKLKTELAGLIDIRDVPVTNIDLTDEMERAIELKQVTEQQALAKEYELKKANKEAEITLVTAKAEAESLRIKNETIEKSQAVILYEIVKKWNGISPQVVVTSQGGANLLLPINK